MYESMLARGPPPCYDYEGWAHAHRSMGEPPSSYDKESWSNEFRSLMDSSATNTHKRPPPPMYELDDPLCQTPPMAPSVAANSACLSPFELDEKRPSKMARYEPTKALGPPVDAPPELQDFRADPPTLFNETEYFDFVEALMAM